MARNVINTKFRGRIASKVKKFTKQRKEIGRDNKWSREAHNHNKQAQQCLFNPKGS